MRNHEITREQERNILKSLKNRDGLAKLVAQNPSMIRLLLVHHRNLKERLKNANQEG